MQVSSELARKAASPVQETSFSVIVSFLFAMGDGNELAVKKKRD